MQIMRKICGVTTNEDEIGNSGGFTTREIKGALSIIFCA